MYPPAQISFRGTQRRLRRRIVCCVVRVMPSFAFVARDRNQLFVCFCLPRAPCRIEYVCGRDDGRCPICLR